jgi:hypothetical protein
MVAQTGQAYAYAGDNPVNRSDPTGRSDGSNALLQLPDTPPSVANPFPGHWTDKAWGEDSKGPHSISVPPTLGPPPWFSSSGSCYGEWHDYPIIVEINDVEGIMAGGGQFTVVDQSSHVRATWNEGSDYVELDLAAPGEADEDGVVKMDDAEFELPLTGAPSNISSQMVFFPAST